MNIEIEKVIEALDSKLENINIQILINETTKHKDKDWLHRTARARAHTIIELKTLKKEKDKYFKANESTLKHERYLINLKQGKYFTNEFMALVKPALGEDLYLDLIAQAKIKVTDKYNDKGVPLNIKDK